MEGSTGRSTSGFSSSDSNSSWVLTEPQESLLTGTVGVTGMSIDGMPFLNANGCGKSGGKPFLATGFAAGKTSVVMTTGSGETHEVRETSSGVVIVSLAPTKLGVKPSLSLAPLKLGVTEWYPRE